MGHRLAVGLGLGLDVAARLFQGEIVALALGDTDDRVQGIGRNLADLLLEGSVGSQVGGEPLDFGLAHGLLLAGGESITGL